MKRSRLTPLLFVPCFIFFVPYVFAGTDSTSSPPASPLSDSRFWFSGGLGMSTLGSLGMSVQASVQFKRVLISVRSTGNMEQLFGDYISDIGLLAGLITHQSFKGHSSVAIGFGMMKGLQGVRISHHGPEEREPIGPAVGLPIEVQFFRNFNRVVGLGLYAYANFNAEKNFGGLTLNLLLGRLR